MKPRTFIWLFTFLVVLAIVLIVLMNVHVFEDGSGVALGWSFCIPRWPCDRSVTHVALENNACLIFDSNIGRVIGVHQHVWSR